MRQNLIAKRLEARSYGKERKNKPSRESLADEFVATCWITVRPNRAGTTEKLNFFKVVFKLPKPVIEEIELVKQGGVGLQLINKAGPGSWFQVV